MNCEEGDRVREWEARILAEPGAEACVRELEAEFLELGAAQEGEIGEEG